MNQSMLSFRPTAGLPLMSRQQTTDISVSRSVISYSSRQTDTNTLSNQQASSLVRPEAVSLDALYFYRLYLNQLTLQQGNVFASDTTHSLFSSHQSAFAPPTVGRDELKTNSSNSSETPYQNSAIVSALSLTPVKNKRQSNVTAEQRWLDHYNKRSQVSTEPLENDQNNNNELSTFCKSSTPTILLTDQNTETKNDNGNLVDSLSCQICSDRSSGLHYGIFRRVIESFLICNMNLKNFSLLIVELTTLPIHIAI
ncbi:hypothetical protein M3Y96_00234800 [Aphelenchoides besseyi]|nr:hypothetical protein M3Y96_00234800 [Aphelenchoides besseyi]